MTTEWLEQTGTEEPSQSNFKRHADEKRVFTTRLGVYNETHTFVTPRQNHTLALNSSISRSIGF